MPKDGYASVSATAGWQRQRAGHLASTLADYLAGDLRKMVDRQAAEIDALAT